MGGCLSRKTGQFDPRTDLNDLTGKVAIVTGAKWVSLPPLYQTSWWTPRISTGIGYHTVKFLARKGAKVYLGARSEVKAKLAIAALEQEGLGSGVVVWLDVNLSDPRWAKKAAEEFLKREKRLDILSMSYTLYLISCWVNYCFIVNNAAQWVLLKT